MRMIVLSLLAFSLVAAEPEATKREDTVVWCCPKAEQDQVTADCHVDISSRNGIADIILKDLDKENKYTLASGSEKLKNKHSDKADQLRADYANLFRRDREWNIPLIPAFEVGKKGKIFYGWQPYIKSVVNETEAIIEFHDLNSRREESVWITGLPTIGLVDGAPFSGDLYFEISGTKKYSTVNGGQRTIWLGRAIVLVRPYFPEELKAPSR